MSKKENLDINADFYGLRTFENALRKVDPDLQKEFQKTAKAPLEAVRNRARRLVSEVSADIPSGWKRPGAGERGWGDRDKRMWDNSKVRNGIVLRKNAKSKGDVRYYYTLMNRSAAGNIYEFAKNAGSKPQGVSFVRALNRQRPSRLIWRAWDESGGDDVLRPAIIKAMNEAAKDIEAAMKAVPKGDRVVLS
jgi:hypothetical protein